MLLRFIQVVVCVYSWSLFIAEHHCITGMCHGCSVRLSKDCVTWSRFWQLWIKLQILTYKFLCEPNFSLFKSQYLQMEWLGHMVNLCLITLRNYNLSFCSLHVSFTEEKVFNLDEVQFLNLFFLLSCLSVCCPNVGHKHFLLCFLLKVLYFQVCTLYF